LTAHFDTIDIWEVDLEKKQVRVKVAGLSNDLLAVGGPLDLKPDVS